jgi:hypothetical protein
MISSPSFAGFDPRFELNDTVHDESEAHGILLFPDKARGTVDYGCQGVLRRG